MNSKCCWYSCITIIVNKRIKYKINESEVNTQKQDCTNDILLPSLNYCKKNYTRRYHRLGNIQTSLDTPHSELSLYKNYNARYPRLEEYQDWSEYSLVWISHVIIF